jgi:hypothetical protein
MEGAREATGTSAKTVLQTRAVQRLQNNKTGLVGLTKAMGLNVLSKVTPVGIAAGAIGSVAATAAIIAGAVRASSLHSATINGGATQEGGPSNYRVLPGLDRSKHKELILHKDGRLVTHEVLDQKPPQKAQ